MRCPDCNKFVPYNTEEEPEENSAEFDGSKFVGSYRRVLTCESCGTELKETEIEIEVEIDGVSEKCPKGEDGEHEWDLDVSADATTDVQRTDRHGKPIKLARYMKTLYGVEVSGTVKCAHCDEEHSFTGSDSQQASGFDELV